MVWVLRMLVVGMFVAVLAFAGGALAVQQGGPGTLPAAIGSILLIAAIPLGILTWIVLIARRLLTRNRRRGRGSAARRAGAGPGRSAPAGAHPGGARPGGARRGAARPSPPRR